MLNTRDLEKRWFKYKIKTMLPYLVIVLSAVIIIISASFYYFSDTESKIVAQTDIATVSVKSNNATAVTNSVPAKKTAPKDIPAIANIIDTNIQIEPQPTANVKEQETKIVLKPSLDFMKKIQNSSDGYYQSSTPKEQTFNTAYVEPQKDPDPVEIIEEVQEVKKTPPPPTKKKKLVIARNTSMEDIRDAEKRFKKNNSPALSLFLAKQYYSLGNYTKSYNYALITNQLDKENETSWLLFSKSLVKLGKTELAKKALSEYIKFSHSSNAEFLLNDITTGKFQ
ncbi:MAG: hypothetical protein ABXS93_00540 [Sulfurimonas sp.]